MVSLLALFGSNRSSFNNKQKSRTKYFQFSLIPRLTSGFFIHSFFLPTVAMAIHLLRAPPLSLLTVVRSKHTFSNYHLPVYKIAIINVRVLTIPN